MAPLVVVLVLSLQAEPPSAQAWAERATKAFQERRYEDALEAAREAYRLDPQPELLNNLGVVLEALGRFDEAADAFRRVVEDPRTTQEIREKDRQRLVALEPRLTSATVRFEPAPDLEATLASAGDSARTDRGEDQRVAPGAVLLTIRRISTTALTARRLELSAGRRTTIRIEEEELRPDDAFIDLGPERVRAMEIDGRRLGWVPDPGARLRLDPGRRAIAWTARDGRPHARTFELAPGETVPLVEAAIVAPPPVAPESSLNLAPWIGGAGVAVAVVGGVLLGVAHGTAASVGPMAGTNVASVTYAEAVAREQRADREASVGVSLMIGGGVTAAGALVWSLVSSP